MEQFKKWKRKKRITTCLCDNISQLEQGWRAALRWVLGQHCTGDWDDGSALETAIKKELGDN